MEDWSFINCTGLKTVILLARFPNEDFWDEFAGCSNVTDIYYFGSENDGLQFHPSESATWHYNSSGPDTE